MPIEETEQYIRVRVKDPSYFQEDSFRTIVLGKDIKAVIGRPKGKETTEIQALLFDKEKWTKEKAQKWMKRHKTLKVKKKKRK